MPTRSEALTPQPQERQPFDKRQPIQNEKLSTFKNIVERRIQRLDPNKKIMQSDPHQKQTKNQDNQPLTTKLLESEGVPRQDSFGVMQSPQKKF